jgi:hypothetical protein
MGYVWMVANLRFGNQSKQATEWAKEQSDLLHADKVDVVRQNALSWKPRKTECCEACKALVGYLNEHASRMMYGINQITISNHTPKSGGNRCYFA